LKEAKNKKIVGFAAYGSENIPKELMEHFTDNLVRIMDLVNLQGMVIDNPVVAKTIKEIFEMVWANVKEPV